MSPVKLVSNLSTPLPTPTFSPTSMTVKRSQIALFLEEPSINVMNVSLAILLVRLMERLIGLCVCRLWIIIVYKLTWLINPVDCVKLDSR